MKTASLAAQVWCDQDGQRCWLRLADAPPVAVDPESNPELFRILKRLYQGRGEESPIHALGRT